MVLLYLVGGSLLLSRDQGLTAMWGNTNENMEIAPENLPTK